MEAVIISGSRNPDGQTAQAISAIRQGLEHGGMAVSQVFLPALRLERCRQCENNGWGLCRTTGSCVIEDDFAVWVEMIRRADAAVFATPVYYGDLSESMRAFTDRLRRICTHEAGRNGIAGKPAVGVCVAGGGGGGAPNCCVSLEKVLSTCGFDMVDMVPARRQNLAYKLETLALTGAWLAKIPRSM
ncbi:MAG: flavodoxin family protein [Anaerolineaceae bacterium]|nr:flavodoxin family protein [Anaerolineaceae bacterium]